MARSVWKGPFVVVPDIERYDAFYKKLIANGKKPLVALTAVMRKLVVICNAKLRNHPLAI